MNQLFIDVETTGTDPDKHAMVELYAEFHKDGQKVDSYSAKFFNKQVNTVDLGALKVNGLNIGELYKLPEEAKAIGDFIDWLLKHKQKFVLVGQNVDFDKNFIKKAFERYGIEGFISLFSHRTYDITSVAYSLIEAGKLPREIFDKSGDSLKNLCAALGIEVDNEKFHTASGDVEYTVKALHKMEEMIRG